MTELITYVLILFGSELVATLVFWLLAKLNKNAYNNRISFSSVIRGLAERAFITFTLVNHLPQALTFFAALKIATRIKEEDKVSNDFYLLGNIFSVTLGIVYSQIYFNYFGQ